MIQSEKGISTIELIVACAIIGLIGSAACMTIFQVFNVTARSNNYITVSSHIQNAGYWISRDAYMAESIVADNLSAPNFMLLTWTERDYESDDIYHSITYFFEELSGGIGKLKRNHWTSAGSDQDVLIAEYMSYDPADPVNTSNATYQESVLTVKLSALFENVNETREYYIKPRQNFN